MIEAPIAAGTHTCAEEDEADGWYQRLEMRDDRVSIAVTELENVERSFSFRLRPTQPGTHHIMPALAFAMYDPDRRGSSGEFLLRVVDRK
ncbi:hypothetical protein HY251_16370 [bacterium]|nr:hypothetical protein [bacterium]